MVDASTHFVLQIRRPKQSKNREKKSEKKTMKKKRSRNSFFFWEYAKQWKYSETITEHIMYIYVCVCKQLEIAQVELAD